MDISGYTINYAVLGGNTDTGSFTKTTTNKDATDSNTDVLISGLNYPNSVYDMSVCLFNTYDMSNTFIDISGLTKPTNFVSADICQNLIDTSSNAIVLKIHNSQDQHSVNIKHLIIDYSGNNGTNSTSGFKTVIPSIVTAHSTNTDVTLSDLSANTTYDLSAHLVNLYDMSNNKLAISGTTRPGDFVAADICQNLIDTSVNTAFLKIHNSQVTGTLDISGYEVYYRATFGSNVNETGTIIKTAIIKTAEGTNNDVSLNDLSENSTYDLSVNLIGSIHDLSNAKIGLSVTTRPSDFVTTDVSQNIPDTVANTLMFNVNNSQKTGTLDISGYSVDISGTNGNNATKQTIFFVPTTKTSDGNKHRCIIE